jgi:hypothetical protein
MSNFFAIFGDIPTYLPMSDLVRFPETYLIKDVQSWKRYLPPKTQYTLSYLSRNAAAVGEESCFSEQNSNNILKNLQSFVKATRKVHIFQKTVASEFFINSDWNRLTKKFFFLLVFRKLDVRFSKTYLATLSDYVPFCLRYRVSHSKVGKVN